METNDQTPTFHHSMLRLQRTYVRRTTSLGVICTVASPMFEMKFPMISGDFWSILTPGVTTFLKLNCHLNHVYLLNLALQTNLSFCQLA